MRLCFSTHKDVHGLRARELFLEPIGVQSEAVVFAQPANKAGLNCGVQKAPSQNRRADQENTDHTPGILRRDVIANGDQAVDQTTIVVLVEQGDFAMTGSHCPQERARFFEA